MKIQKKAKQYFNQLILYVHSTASNKKLSNVTIAKTYQFFSPVNNSISHFKIFLEQAQKQINPFYLINFLNIIHGTFQYHNYNPIYLQQFQNFMIPELSPLNKLEQWLREVNINYYNYLTKIALNRQLYNNIIINNINVKQPILTVFMLINQFNSFITQAKQIFNVSGRYYFDKLPEIPYFYELIRNQFGLMYEYLRNLTKSIVKNYIKYQPEELECFLQSSNQIDKINDIMQELYKNKYYSHDGNIKFIQLSNQQQYEIIKHLILGQTGDQNVQNILKF